MKKILIFTCFILFLISCATGPAEDQTAESSDQIIEQKEPKLMMKTVSRVLTIVSFFDDGKIDEKTIYSYGDNALIPFGFEVHDAFGTLLEYAEYSIEEDKLMKISSFDSFGELVSSKKFVYNEAGLLHSESFIDELGDVLSMSEYAYNVNGQKILWTIYNNDGAKLADTKYIYKNNVIQEIESFDPDGRKEEYFSFKYSDGMKMKSEHFFVLNTNMKLADYITYEYNENNKIINQRNYDYEGRAVITIKYKYDGNGNVVEETVYDGEGNIKQMYTFEYDVFDAEIWTTDY